MCYRWTQHDETIRMVCDSSSNSQSYVQSHSYVTATSARFGRCRLIHPVPERQKKKRKLDLAVFEVDGPKRLSPIVAAKRPSSWSIICTMAHGIDPIFDMYIVGHVIHRMSPLTIDSSNLGRRAMYRHFRRSRRLHSAQERVSSTNMEPGHA